MPLFGRVPGSFVPHHQGCHHMATLREQDESVFRETVFRASSSFRAMALVGIKEIAEMLGVSRTRADQLSRRPNFPEPKIRHARVRLWEDTDVKAWMEANRRSRD